jgi:hypothetical protein
MKSLFFILLFTSLQGIAQKVPQQVNTWYKFWGVNHDSILQLPRIAPQTRYQDTGDIYYNRSDKKIHWRTENRDTTFVQQNLDSLRAMLRNSFQNDTDIVLMCGTVRLVSSATPHTWAWVSQLTPDHYTLGFDSLLVTDAPVGGFTVHYPHQAKPITFLAVPDETYALSGWQFGASVGYDSATVFMTRSVYSGVMLWYDNINPPNYIDEYFGNGITTTYDTTTGNFVTSLIGLVPRYLSSRPNVAISITNANTHGMVPVVDGQATLSEPSIYKLHWNMRDKITDTVIHGVKPLQPIAILNGPAYWTTDYDGELGGSSNVWIFAAFKKN